MIRLIGAVLLTGGGAALGLGAVRHMERRVQDLSMLSMGLAVIRRELGWQLSALPDLLCEAAEKTKGAVSDFFRLCSVGAKQLNGRPFSRIWTCGLESVRLRIEPEDMAVLEQLGGVLGRYGSEEQMLALDAAVQRLDEQVRSARDQRNRLGKVYGALGLTAGAFLVILLI